MKNKIIATVAALAVAFTLSACSSPAAPVKHQETTKTQVTEPKATPVAPTPTYSVEQTNAIAKAKEYLALMGISQQSLETQLEFEGFSPDVSKWAIEQLGNVDWNQEAAEKGASYLQTQPMSKEALINQLEFEKFTPEQAAAGAAANGL